MKKPWLLMAGSSYYPQMGTGDWIGFFETKEEAESHIFVLVGELVKTKHGDYYDNNGYIINNEKYDWYDLCNVSDYVSDKVQVRTLSKLEMPEKNLYHNYEIRSLSEYEELIKLTS